MSNRSLVFFGIQILCTLFCTAPVASQETVAARNLILDADTANEIDDMYAIVRMLKQDQFNVLALSSAQWIHYLGEADSVGASQRINEDLVELLGRKDLPLPKGSDEPMGKPWGGDEAKDSAAAQFIIKAAKAASPDSKLMVVCLGATTNLASAIKLAPEIVPNVDAYLLGFQYDASEGVWNKSEFNIRRDLNAADFILNCEGLSTHIMPTSVAKKLTFDRDDTFARHERMGALGKYLTDKWKARFGSSKTWVMWDLALVQAVINPELGQAALRQTPPENTARKVLVYSDIDAEAMRKDYWKTVLPK